MLSLIALTGKQLANKKAKEITSPGSMWLSSQKDTPSVYSGVPNRA